MMEMVEFRYRDRLWEVPAYNGLGKFEGEPDLVRVLWEKWGNEGTCDEVLTGEGEGGIKLERLDGEEILSLDVSNEEESLLLHVWGIILTWNSSGFVSGEFFFKKQGFDIRWAELEDEERQYLAEEDGEEGE